VVVLPVLVMIVLGCIDFGRFAYTYIALNNAVRAGASYGIMNNYQPSTQGTWITGITTAAQQEMNGQIGYVTSNLTVQAPVVTVESSGLRNVQVTASYPFKTIVNWSGVPSSTINLTSSVTMRLIR
jgi:Flp pilus assembly protein TadG